MVNDSFPIVIYGDSLLMSGMVVTLHNTTDLNLIQVNPNSDLAQQTLDAMQTGVLICDLGNYNARVMTDFIFAHPNVTVIGLHFEADRAVTLVCREHPLQATTELVQIITDSVSFL